MTAYLGPALFWLIQNISVTHLLAQWWVVLATGPGNPPEVRFLAGGSVRFGSVPDHANNPTRFVLAGLLPGPDINPRVFGLGGTAPLFDFTVLSTGAQHWPQLSIWVLIVLWHDQYASCGVLCADWHPAFRFAIRPIFIESLWNKTQCEVKITGFRSLLNQDWWAREFASRSL